MSLLQQTGKACLHLTFPFTQRRGCGRVAGGDCAWRQSEVCERQREQKQAQWHRRTLASRCCRAGGRGWKTKEVEVLLT